MIKQIRQEKGDMTQVPLSAATKKVIWQQGVQATPDPMSLDGSQHCPHEVTVKIPRLWSRWLEITEGNRPYRQARHAEALADATANELLLEECRREVRKQEKESIGVARLKKEKPSETLSGPNYFDGVWQGAAIIREGIWQNAAIAATIGGNRLVWPTGLVSEVEISDLCITIPSGRPRDFHRGTLEDNQLH